MKKEKAIEFAGLMEDYLNIPSFICEMIEKDLCDEKYKETIEYVINRRNEIESKEDYICEQQLINKLIKLQSNWNSLRELIEDEKTRLATECSHTYEDSLGKTKYVNEDIYNELDKILDKMNELESGDKN